MKEKTSLLELNFTDIKENKDSWVIPILPWGAIEPHGEHLSYLTDSFIANQITLETINDLQKNELTKNKFISLPCISMGQQNLGQVDKKFCINFSFSTQYAVLEDIVKSLLMQGIKKLVIVNGHNGNDFKPIVRDLAVNYPDFKIYVCNYLSLIDKYTKSDNDLGIVFPETDDHAAFTETSLMLYLQETLVDENNIDLSAETNENWKKLNISMWTPRNFDDFSINNRIGDVKGASKEIGEKLFNLITIIIESDLISIL